MADIKETDEVLGGKVVNISPSAEQYLLDLLSKQDDDDTGVRVFITDPGTPMAETCIAYCRPGEVQETDQPFSYDGFTAWIDGPSIPYLADSEVDFAEDRMGGQLTIKAPNSKVPRVSEDSPLEEKINYILQSEVNPSLASHGGMVSLVELVDEDVAVLQFGGGCQGCGMVDMTLKDGVEKTLLEQLPQLREVRDITDHSQGENPYYQ